jgi:hypothetical protein
MSLAEELLADLEDGDDGDDLLEAAFAKAENDGMMDTDQDIKPDIKGKY